MWYSVVRVRSVLTVVVCKLSNWFIIKRLVVRIRTVSFSASVLGKIASSLPCAYGSQEYLRMLGAVVKVKRVSPACPSGLFSERKWEPVGSVFTLALASTAFMSRALSPVLSSDIGRALKSPRGRSPVCSAAEHGLQTAGGLFKVFPP